VVTLVLGSVLSAGEGTNWWRAFLAYALGAILVSFVSWLDDLRSIPSWMRLLVHAAAASTAIAGIGYWKTLALPVVGSVEPGWFGAVVSLVWIVGLTNAYNFMDGIDGIAGGQSVVAGLGWVLLAWQGGLPVLSGLCLLVAAASLGFLLHNWPPARIFMGDVGSAFLGYTLAVVPLMYSFLNAGDHAGRALLIGVLLVWPFVFDTAFTFLRRLIRGENVFSAHRSHLYQRLVTTGWGHQNVTVLYIGLALAGALLGQVWSTRVIGGDFTSLAFLPLLAASLWILVIVQEHRGDSGVRVQSGIREGH
jgi:UDP-N-acetylmuramyl pentapeptide phosphotransferase/UDP-N-acetylglucosamine-1-phosphate transferase